MKVRKAKKRFEPKPKIQPKRNDLNTQQMGILSKVQQAGEPLIQSFEIMLGELGIEELQKAPNSFWDPGIVSLELGISLPTMDNYIHHYLRVIRRTEEEAKDFTLRKRASESQESPLGETPSGYFRWVNTRVLLFIVAGITKVPVEATILRGIRERINKELGIQLGGSMKIPSFETQVHTFEVRK